MENFTQQRHLDLRLCSPRGPSCNSWEQYGTVLVSRGQLKQTSGSEMCCRLARAIPIPKGCHSVSLMLFQWSSWRLVRGVFLSCGQPWADSPERIVDLPSFVHEGHPLACQPLAQTIFRPMHARKQVAVCSVERDSPGTLAVDIGCFIKRNI